MKASVKYKVIYRHREKYSISEMCRFFGVSRSGYIFSLLLTSRKTMVRLLVDTILTGEDDLCTTISIMHS